MNYLLIISIFLIIFSTLLIFKPSMIFKLNRWGDKVIFTDSEFFSFPRISGMLFIVIGIIVIYISFYFKELSIVVEIIQNIDIVFYIFFTSGVISIVFGSVFIVKPEIIIKSSKITNKVLISDEQIFKYPGILGIFLLITSLFILYIAIKY